MYEKVRKWRLLFGILCNSSNQLYMYCFIHYQNVSKKKIVYNKLLFFQGEQIDSASEDSGLEQTVTYFVNLYIL